MKQLALTVAVSAAVSGGVSWLSRPVPDPRQMTRIERLERRLQWVATAVGLVFGEDGA